jgi:hypothetical protein
VRRRSRHVLGLSTALLIAGPLAAQEPDWTEVKARRQTDGVRSLQVDVEFVAGELRVERAAAGLLYDSHLRYDASRLRPSRRWSIDGEMGRLEMSFDGVGGDGDLDFDLAGDEHGFLTLRLGPDVPIGLRFTVGAARGELELGGIPLTSLAYRTGASDTDLGFGSVNPVRMSVLELLVGAAEFEAGGLGNARFEELRFKGGVGDVRLDFTGDWSGDAAASVEMGLGSLTLVVPPGLGVQIRKTGFLAALDAPGFEKVDGTWRTVNWDSAAHHLEIDLKAALGSIEVVRSR